MKKSPATVISEKKCGKWCRFFLTGTLLMLWSCAALYAQTESSRQQKITATYKNNTITEVLEDLKTKTGYTFVHKQHEIDGNIKITEHFTGTTLDDILQSVLVRHGYDYSIESRVIVIRRQVKQTEVKRKEVHGTVRDDHGELLPGVTVRLKNTTMGTATDNDGKYTLTFPDGEYTLVFSMVGMQECEERIGMRTEIDVVMQQVAAEMDEVVVTGIFKKARESYTGAVSTIGKEEILAYRGQNMLQTLRNIDPAFNVVQNNEFGSDPNRLPDITVRGSSSLTTNLKELNEGTKNDLNVPLIIMDDFEISLTKLMDYNEEEIESINILKDAAATAIYGSRGANGVVVIVSKKPQAGKLRVFAQAGMTLEIPDLTSYDLMNARDKLSLEWAAGLYHHETNPERDIVLKEAYYKRLKAVEEGVETDWLSQPLHVGVGQNYNLRFEGGSEEFRWSASLGYKDIQGAMIGSGRKTFSGGVTLSYSYKNLTFRNQTSIGRKSLRLFQRLCPPATL